MVILDFLVLIPLCWYGFLGFRHGLIYEIFSLLALILGCWLSNKFAETIAIWIGTPIFSKPISFILIFICTLVLVHLVGRYVKKAVKMAIPPFIDKLFGLLFGVTKVLLISSVILYFIQGIDKYEIIIKKETKENSKVYKYVEPIAPHALQWKDELIDKNAEE